jgi:hypothetical protein
MSQRRKEREAGKQSYSCERCSSQQQGEASHLQLVLALAEADEDVDEELLALRHRTQETNQPSYTTGACQSAAAHLHWRRLGLAKILEEHKEQLQLRVLLVIPSLLLQLLILSASLRFRLALTRAHLGPAIETPLKPKHKDGMCTNRACLAGAGCTGSGGFLSLLGFIASASTLNMAGRKLRDSGNSAPRERK